MDVERRPKTLPGSSMPEPYPVTDDHVSEEMVWPEYQPEGARDAPKTPPLALGRSFSLKKILTRRRSQPRLQSHSAENDCVLDNPTSLYQDNGKYLMSGALHAEEVWPPRNSLDIAEASRTNVPDTADFEDASSNHSERPRSTADISDIPMHKLPSPDDFEDVPITPPKPLPQSKLSRPPRLDLDVVNDRSRGDIEAGERHDRV
jgi:hypothetical protein